MTIPPVINFEQWVAANAAELVPPVNNKQVWDAAGDFIVQVLGGPNQRTDYHIDPYEEWFYQIRGDMHVNIMTEQGPQRIDVREGSMWMLPRNVPHSPQRPNAGAIGLVIERIREPETTEKFVWYCPSCNHLIYEAELHVSDIVEDLPPVFEQFYADEQARTCENCGTLHPGRG